VIVGIIPTGALALAQGVLETAPPVL